MLYRALLGFVPLILIALIGTGAIPLSSVVPTREYRTTEVRADEKKPDQMGPMRNGGEVVAEQLGKVYGVRPDQASLMREELRELEEEQKREARERAFEARSPGWNAKSGGGWGRAD